MSEDARSEDAVAGVFCVDDLLPDDARHWQRTARRLAREVLAPTIEDDFDAQRLRAEHIPALGEAGLLGMHLHGYGCAGASATAYGAACLEIESVDSGWRTFVSVQGSLTMTAIAQYGSEQHKQRWLPELAAGRAVGCFALTEPAGGSDPAAMTTFARREGTDWVLRGRKRWIGLASLARIAVVWARTDDGVRGFLVPTDARGVTARPIPGKRAMRTSIQCDIDLDDVHLPSDAVLPDAHGLRAPFTAWTRPDTASPGVRWARPVPAWRSPSLAHAPDTSSVRRSVRASSSRRSLPTCSSSTRRARCWRCTWAG